MRRLRVGRGVVTAFCAAPGSGEVFLGFEGGEVYVVRPERSEVARVAHYGLAVTAMAASHGGESLVTLRSSDAGRGVLSTYAREPGGSYQTLLGTVLAVESPSHPGLSPILPRAGGDQIGLWDGRELHILAAASLTWERSLSPAAETLAPPVLLIPWPLGPDEAQFAAFAHDGRVWTLFDADGGVFQGTRLNWRPSLPPANPLRSVPLSWMSGVPDHLELAGLGGYGTLNWAAFRRDGRRLDLSAMSVTTEEGGGYLAAAIVQPRMVAGVTRTRIDWLRGGPNRFVLRATTPAAIPSAVACVANPRTGELIVICGDGLIVRVPIPF